MDASYLKPFIDATRAVFTTMLKLEVACGRPEVVEALQRSDVSGIIGMSGEVVGSVVLRLPDPVATQLVTRFTGLDLSAASEDFADAIGELVNIICGGAKAKFGNRTVSISCPCVVMGAGHTVSRPRNTPCVSIPCTTPFGGFCLEIAIRPDAAVKSAA